MSEPIMPGVPTASAPMLIGILVDVSGSMLGSIQNRSGRSENRLQSFQQSLDDLVARGRELSRTESVGTVLPLFKLFAYGFGFGNPLSALLGRSGPKVRDLFVGVAGHGASTIGIDDLAERWTHYRAHVEGMAAEMFGDTPMGDALRITSSRFTSELASGAYMRPAVLFMLSDGDPTDALPHQIEEAAGSLKEAGIMIVSCFVTGEDITQPRRLYGSAPEGWSTGARLMFECASTLPEGSPFAAYLKEYGWQIDKSGRLFTQVNQSEILSEFLGVVLSPLSQVTSAGSRAVYPTLSSNTEHPGQLSTSGTQRRRTRIFVTYSHEDQKYLQKDSLLGYLTGLEREGFHFWTDEDIRTGDDWNQRIRSEIADADIALALVSQSFLNSKYCQDVEIASFLERRRREGLIVYPVIIAPCDWQSYPWLSSTQFQPRGGRTIETHFKDKGKRAVLFLEILRELREIGGDAAR